MYAGLNSSSVYSFPGFDIILIHLYFGRSPPQSIKDRVQKDVSALAKKYGLQDHVKTCPWEGGNINIEIKDVIYNGKKSETKLFVDEVCRHFSIER
jgi:hypothetical protein